MASPDEQEDMTPATPEARVTSSQPLPSPVSKQDLANRMFSGQQLALLKALERLEPELAVMYRGGLMVLANSENPDRFALCAHSMRELLEKLPEYLGVSMKAQDEKLKDKVCELKERFDRMQKATRCLLTPTGWEGEIDKPFRKFLRCLTTFWEWFEEHNPRRRQELHVALTKLDGSGRDLPAPLAALNVQALMSKREYFQSVAHHRKHGVEDEFRKWLDALERFLLDGLMPRTFDDFSEINAILGEEDSNA